jgi:hypothetical protein
MHQQWTRGRKEIEGYCTVVTEALCKYQLLNDADLGTVEYSVCVTENPCLYKRVHKTSHS